MSGQMDDNELISLIETYPILYAKDSARGSKNASRKDAAWKVISMKLGASERACITRWKSIRDRFGKEFRRFQDNPNEPTYWDIFPRLLFLKDHYKQGLAKHESLEKIKFEPKERRRRRRSRSGIKLDPEDDLDADEIEFSQLLIEQVKLYPVLYDRQKIRDSKNLSAKNDAWRDISERLETSEELCYNRWKKLRSRFAREYHNHQINREAAITWKFFNDMLFLVLHYRKGVPLVIENLKKRGRPTKQLRSPSNPSNGEQVWGTDYPYSSDNEEIDDPEPDADPMADPDDNIEMVTESEEDTEFVPLDDLIQVEQPASSSPQQPQQQQQQQLTVPDSAQSITLPVIITEQEVPTEGYTIITDVMAETPGASKLIGTVINNMETVLRQSKDCLQALHAEQERHQLELQAMTMQNPSSILTKAQMLLDGLSGEQRRNAERKIIHFLCECQIRTLDGGEIEDVAPCQIYNT